MSLQVSFLSSHASFSQTVDDDVADDEDEDCNASESQHLLGVEYYMAGAILINICVFLYEMCILI